MKTSSHAHNVHNLWQVHAVSRSLNTDCIRRRTPSGPFRGFEPWYHMDASAPLGLDRYMVLFIPLLAVKSGVCRLGSPPSAFGLVRGCSFCLPTPRERGAIAELKVSGRGALLPLSRPAILSFPALSVGFTFPITCCHCPKRVRKVQEPNPGARIIIHEPIA